MKSVSQLNNDLSLILNQLFLYIMNKYKWLFKLREEIL